MAQVVWGRGTGVIALVVTATVVATMRSMDAREPAISIEIVKFLGAEMHLIDINYHEKDYRERAFREILN